MQREAAEKGCRLSAALHIIRIATLGAWGSAVYTKEAFWVFSAIALMAVTALMVALRLR